MILIFTKIQFFESLNMYIAFYFIEGYFTKKL